MNSPGSLSMLTAEATIKGCCRMAPVPPPRQNTVSSFASSFSDEDHLNFFSDTQVTLRYYFIAVSYLCLQLRRLMFGNGLQLMLLFVKIKSLYVRHMAVWVTKGLLNNMVSFLIFRTFTLKLGVTILSRF